MKREIRSAFESVRNGWSPDRVVADPELNLRFVEECARIGLTETPARLNQALLNLRKGGGLKGSPKSRITKFSDEDNYRFASEIAARFLERRDGVSLDQIICNPATAAEFDQIAASLAPGFSSLQYRWAALALRKTRKLRPEIISQAIPSVAVTRHNLDQIDPAKISTSQGLYIFSDSQQVLYVGEAANLRVRIEKHLDHSDNKHLARWLWDKGAADVSLELHELEDKITTKIRRALESELIKSRRPLFNIQGS